MKKQRQKNNLLQKTLVSLMAVTCMFTAISPMKASAHSAYYLSTTLNVANSRYEPAIMSDEKGFTHGHSSHRESKLGYIHGYDWENVNLTSDLENLKKDKFVSHDLVNNPYLIFTFPGIENSKGYDGGSLDLARAEWVSRTMIQSLNDAIGFIVQDSGLKPNQSELIKLGTELANASVKNVESTITYNGKSYKVTGNKNAPEDERRIGVTGTAYVKIVTPSKKTRHFVYKVPKGYIKLGGSASAEQKKVWSPLAENVPSDLKDEVNEGDTKYLTWKHVVLQAHYYVVKHNIYYNTLDEVIKPSKLESTMTDLGDNLMLGLRSMLGLYSFSELMLNDGERGGTGYFKGIMPMTWFESANILHWVSVILAWMLMILAFVRLFSQRNLASINIAKRVDLMEGVKSIITVGFALMMFNPIFYFLAHMNFLLVDIMKNTSTVTSNFGAYSPGSGVISFLIINGAYLVMELYFNFIYIARAIAVMVLYATGPLFVASLAFGSKYSQMFSTYMRELVGNIYVQTFHALLVALFASLSTFGGLRLFEQLVVLFAFIPMTKFFREATGIGGGLMDVGAGAFGAVGGLAQAGSKKMRSGGGKSSSYSKSNASSSKSSTTGEGMQSHKSFADYQTGNNGKGSGSMVGNDNATMSKGGNGSATKPGGEITPGGGGASAPSNAVLKQNSSNAGGGTVSMASNDVYAKANRIREKKDEFMNSTAGKTMGAGVQAGNAISAVGMAAVDNGSVGQNMGASAGNRKPNFKKSSTQHASAQNSPGFKQQAPKSMGDYENTGNYEGYEPDNGNFTHSFRKDNGEGYDQMYDEHAIKHVEMDGKDIAYTYDYDLDAKSFNSGKYYTGADNEKMMDMYMAFNGGSEERKDHYTKQGITGVSYTKGEGMKVTAKPGTNHVHGVQSTNTHHRFTKTPGSNTNANMLDSIRTGNEREKYKKNT